MESYDENKLYQILQQKKTLVFDMDGTMANTEPVHFLSHKKMLEEYGANLTKEEYIKNHIGKSDAEHQKDFEDLFGIKLTSNHFDRRFELYTKMFFDRNIKPFEYLVRTLEKFKNKELVILSASNRKLIKECLLRWGITKYFNKIFSVMDDKITKKEFFSNPKKYLDKDINEIAVFEDSVNTINFCNKKGITTIFVEHNFNKDKEVEYTLKIVENEAK